MSHTPGPWYWSDSGYGEDCDPPEPGKRWIEISDSDATEVCCIVNRLGQFRSDQLTNARLIAAAPDLYSSLKNLLEICRWKCSPLDEQLLPDKTNEQAMLDACDVLDRIAAIEKATGKEGKGNGK